MSSTRRRKTDMELPQEIKDFLDGCTDEERDRVVERDQFEALFITSCLVGVAKGAECALSDGTHMPTMKAFDSAYIGHLARGTAPQFIAALKAYAARGNNIVPVRQDARRVPAPT